MRLLRLSLRAARFWPLVWTARQGAKSAGRTFLPRNNHSAADDAGDDAHRQRRVDREHLFGIDADLVLTGHDRPVDLVVILPRFDLSDVRHSVRLVLDRPVFGPADDRPRRHARMQLDRNAQPAIDRERVVRSFCAECPFYAKPGPSSKGRPTWSRSNNADASNNS
jgi:hypothetical protein